VEEIWLCVYFKGSFTAVTLILIGWPCRVRDLWQYCHCLDTNIALVPAYPRSVTAEAACGAGKGVFVVAMKAVL